MARDGFFILDSDLHMMEPDDLWGRYLDGPHKANPPVFFGGQRQKLDQSKEDKGNADSIMGMEVQGLAIPAHNMQQGVPCRAANCAAAAGRATRILTSPGPTATTRRRR